jgi:hypothetical protein
MDILNVMTCDLHLVGCLRGVMKSSSVAGYTLYKGRVCRRVGLDAVEGRNIFAPPENRMTMPQLSCP